MILLHHFDHTFDDGGVPTEVDADDSTDVWIDLCLRSERRGRAARIR
ncbi:MAG: hypothetical protein R3E12_04505 [Candidatus Eisenbacteria bacterium]